MGGFISEIVVGSIAGFITVKVVPVFTRLVKRNSQLYNRTIIGMIIVFNLFILEKVTLDNICQDIKYKQ